MFNALSLYPQTRLLKSLVHPRAGGLRPTIELEPTDHPLAVEQREGITAERLIEIVALRIVCGFETGIRGGAALVGLASRGSGGAKPQAAVAAEFF